MKNIPHPKKNILIIFSIFSLLFLTLYVWNFSFTWGFVFGVTHYVIFLLTLLLIGIMISVFIDKKHETKLKYYFIIPFVQLSLIWLISNPIREWQIKNSKENGVHIVELIETYKKENGTYPKSILELENETNTDLPKRTTIGTKYIYELNDNGKYYIGFKSYYGYDFHYDKETKEWFATD